MNEQEQNPHEQVRKPGEKDESPFAACCARFYEITVKGQLGSQWAEWLEGLEVKLAENGEMTLCGTIVDQSALLGMLNKLSRLNLDLLSVCQVNVEDLCKGEQDGEQTRGETG